MPSYNLEDIAKKAGVSRSTVSRVVNNNEAVSAATRKRVQAVIDEMGFAPNPAARSLVTRRTQLIGVVIPGVDGFGFTIALGNAVYYPLLLQGMAEATDSKDYGMLLWVQDPSSMNEERFYGRIVRSRMMDGLVVAAPKAAPHFVEELMQNRTPFVMVDYPSHRADEIDYVGVDNVQAVRQVVRHLYDQGCRRIGTITGFLGNVEAQQRLAGYQRGLADVNLPHDPSLVWEGNWNYDSGYRLTENMLANGVDAIFAAHDETAFGVLDALAERNVNVPGEVAVVGFDDLPAAERTNPPLTSVRQLVKQRGATAIERLIDIIENGATSPQHIIMPAELVVRESSAVKGVMPANTE